MFERRIQVQEGDRLTLVEMTQDVVLVGGDQADVLIRLRDGQEEDLGIEVTEAGPAMSVRAACEVQVPTWLPVTVRQVAGNLKVRGLADLNAEQVRGNLKLDRVSQVVIAEVYGNLKANATGSLRLVGTIYGNANLHAVQAIDLQNVRGNLQTRVSDHLRASRISGNLQAREIGGPLDVDQVGGNAQLKGVSGSLTLDQVAGNLVAKNLTGGARVPRIGGNLVLNGDLGAGTTYQFKADGNATLRLSEGAGAHLTLRSAGKLLSSVALAAEERDGDTLTGTLGDGGAEIVIEADGNVMLGGAQPAIGAEIGVEISRQVQESLRAIDLEAIGREVSGELEAAMSRLRVKLESADWDRIGHQSQHAVERAMDRMQRDMDRMVEKAARRQARLEHKAERQARRSERLERKGKREMQRQPESEVEADRLDWLPGEAAEPVLSVAEGPVEPQPNLDEERLSILKMVEQGQITPVEAEMLLDALT